MLMQDIKPGMIVAWHTFEDDGHGHRHLIKVYQQGKIPAEIIDGKKTFSPFICPVWY